VFENKMLRRIFGTTWDEVKEAQKRLHNEQILIWVIKSTTVRYAEYVARTGDRKGAHRVLMDRSERKRALLATNSAHPLHAE